MNTIAHTSLVMFHPQNHQYMAYFAATNEVATASKLVQVAVTSVSIV